MLVTQRREGKSPALTSLTIPKRSLQSNPDYPVTQEKLLSELKLVIAVAASFMH